jgi:Lhr-like helicase
VAYLAAGRAALGALPRQDLLIAERFFDEGGGMQLVIHAPLGGRLNRAWGLALRKRFCRGFNFELQAAATDDGIVISLGQPHSFPLASVFGYVPSNLADDVLVQALLDQPMFEVRWRWNVTRALVVARRHGGKKVAPNLVRMRAADLLSVVFPQAQACLETVVGDREIPDHPLVARHLARLLDRGPRRRRADRAVSPHRARRDQVLAPRRGRAVAAVPRAPQRQPLRVPRRRARSRSAGPARSTCGAACRPSWPSGPPSARWRPRPSPPPRTRSRRSSGIRTSCTTRW